MTNSEREQHACLLQFLGGAAKLYPKELSDGIQLRESLLTLRARKEQFDDVLQQAAKGLLSDSSSSNAPTTDSIDRGVEELRAEIKLLQRDREQLLLDTLAATGRGRSESLASDIELSEKRQRVIGERTRLADERSRTEQRLEELLSYKTTVSAEQTRIKRVEVAGELFKPLSVSRCPHCDQRVRAETAPSGHCFVCHQHLPAELLGTWSGAKRRLAFESEQLASEDEELTELVEKLRTQNDEIVLSLRNADEELTAVDVLLRPARSRVAAFLPPSLGMLDTKVGQLEERSAQRLRLRDAIDQRDALARNIAQLEERVQSIASQIDEVQAEIPFDDISNTMSEGINEYLDLLNEGDAARWTHGPVRFRIDDRSLKLMIGDRPWSSVGATSGGLVVLGYHYALLRISARNGYNYPGLALIDFPMTLADGASIASKENYLVEPFVALANANQAVQVVLCGRAFRALKGVNRISLTEVWKQGEGATDVESRRDSLQVVTGAPAETGRVADGSTVSFTVAAHFHSNKEQIMMVLDHDDVKKLATLLPDLGAALSAKATWPGKDVSVVWGGGKFVTKLVHHIDNRNVKFTVRKSSARPLWQHLDALLRTDHPAREFSARYIVTAGDGLDQFFIEVSLPSGK